MPLHTTVLLATTMVRVPLASYHLLRGAAVPAVADELLCNNLQGNGNDAEEFEAALAALVARPVAIELLPSEILTRCFLLPGAFNTTIQELEFEDGSIGHCVWDASIALSIFLACNAASMVGEQRVLELGSGCGLAGLTAGLAGAKAVTLSERAVEPPSPWDKDAAAGDAGMPLQLLENLKENTRRNALSDRVSVMPLEWTDYAEGAPDGVQETFPVVIGSDLAYYEQTAPALAATIARVTAPGGIALLMSKKTRRPGLETVHRLLGEAGELQVEEWSLLNSQQVSFNNDGRTAFLLTTFRKSG